MFVTHTRKKRGQGLLIFFLLAKKTHSPFTTAHTKMKQIKKEITKTRYKVLFNNILLESNNFVKVKVVYNKSLAFLVEPVDNSILNKHLLRI